MNSTTEIRILAEKLEDEILKSLRENADDNPMKGTPLESMFYLNIMNNTVKEFKSFLNTSKLKFDISDDEIEKIGSRGYNSVYSKLFDDGNENDEDDELLYISQSQMVEDAKQIKLLFYQYCFDEEVTELFLEDSQNSKIIAKKMAETTTISESITYSLFKSYLTKSDINFTEIDITKFNYKSFDFNLTVDRVIIGSNDNYLEILSNDFENIVIPDDDVLPLTLANNFVVYVEKFKPKFLYVVIQDPIFKKYALRKIAKKGISSNVTFMPNNERDTIVDAVLKYNV